MNDLSTNGVLKDAEVARSRQGILRRRAVLLARPPAEEKADAGEVFDVTAFNLAYERYAFESIYVREVYPLHKLTPLPCTPPFIAGIINVRGRILSIVDLRVFFDLPSRGLGALDKVIILHSGDMEMGILADQIIGTFQLRNNQLQSPLPTMTGIRKDYLKGIGPEQLAVLDAISILTDQKMIIKEN